MHADAHSSVQTSVCCARRKCKDSSSLCSKRVSRSPVDDVQVPNTHQIERGRGLRVMAGVQHRTFMQRRTQWSVMRNEGRMLWCQQRHVYAGVALALLVRVRHNMYVQRQLYRRVLCERTDTVWAVPAAMTEMSASI